MTVNNPNNHEQTVIRLFEKLNISYCGICGNYFMGNAYLNFGGDNGKPVSLAVTAELLCGIPDKRAPLDTVCITVTGPSGRLGTRKFSFDDLFGTYQNDDEDGPSRFFILPTFGWNRLPDPDQMERGIAILNQYIRMFVSCHGG